MIRLKDLLQEQTSILRRGSRGKKVEELQKQLIQLGLLPEKQPSGKTSADGIFGSGTKAAIVAFQKDPNNKDKEGNKLNPDGVVGPATYYALGIANRNISPSKNIPDDSKKEADDTPIPSPDSSLSFNGSKVNWIDNGRVVKSWNAISGLTILNTPPKDYDKLIRRYISRPEDFAKSKNAGPTPPGVYRLGPLQKRKNDLTTMDIIKKALQNVLSGDYSKFGTNFFNKQTARSAFDWGNYRAYLNPRSGEQFGRTSFYIHGGTVKGSHGCIDLTSEMDDFGAFYSVWLTTHNLKSIDISVSYGKGKNGAISRLWNFHKGDPIFDLAPDIVQRVLNYGIEKALPYADNIVAKYGDQIKDTVKSTYKNAIAAKKWVSSFFS